MGGSSNGRKSAQWEEASMGGNGNGRTASMGADGVNHSQLWVKGTNGNFGQIGQLT